MREGVPRGVIEVGLGCMLVVETGFFEQPAAFLSVFCGRLDQPSGIDFVLRRQQNEP